MRIFLFILLLFSINGFSQQAVYTNVNSYNIRPQNNGIDNRINLQKCINNILKSGGGTLFFPKGHYAIQFDDRDTALTILLQNGGHLSFLGEENKSIIEMQNENPTHAYHLFYAEGNEQKSYINFNQLHLKGPQNPGNHQEQNKATHAIYIGQGNIETNIKKLTISGNFFCGMVATGGHLDYCRKLTIRNSVVESYGAFSVGMFGVTTCNELICDNVHFKRCGLASNETTDKQAFGVSVYCHPDVSTKITNCQFFNNHRNSIQFASGTKLYNKRYSRQPKNTTKYQLFENNYFDSTATDGIQLGFYYPNPIIRNNVFHNFMYGIEVMHSATIEYNYFGPKVAAAITHTSESIVTNEDEIDIKINNNQFYSTKAIYVYNNNQKALCKSIESFNNHYECAGQSIFLGSTIVGDSSDVIFNSVSDTFYSTKNGGFFLGYSYKVYIHQPIVFGSRFIYVGANPMNSLLMDSNSIVFINNMRCPKNMDYCAPIFNNSQGAKPKIVVWNSFIDSINLYKLVGNYGQSNNNYIYPRMATSTDTIVVNNNIGTELSTNFDHYYLSGEGAIDNIFLFNAATEDPINNWQSYFEGRFHFETINTIETTTKGNIVNPAIIKAHTKFDAVWNRTLHKWIIELP